LKLTQPGAECLGFTHFRLEFRVYAVRAEPAGDRLKAELQTGGTLNAPGKPCRGGGNAGSPPNRNRRRGFEAHPAGRRVFGLCAYPFGVPRLRGAGGEPPEGGTPNGRDAERAWEALPWWKRGFTPEPQPLEGI